MLAAHLSELKEFWESEGGRKKNDAKYLGTFGKCH